MLWVFLAAGFSTVFLAHTAPFPFVLDQRGALWHMPAGRDTPRIYLTFDDGPNPTATPELLDVLAREGARATFFLIPRHVTDETAATVRRMFEDGHAVALHSHTRAHMILTPDALAATLTAAADRIERFTGHRPCAAYRPHAGWRSRSMYDGLAQIDHTLVGWSWMLWDWNWFRRRSPTVIVNRILARASPGDIVVLHDGHHKNPRADRRYAVDVTERLIPSLRARGFDFGTVC